MSFGLQCKVTISTILPCRKRKLNFVLNANFGLCFPFFSLSYLYKVSSRIFSTSFLAQSRIMAKTFYKTASLVAMTQDGNCCEDFL